METSILLSTKNMLGVPVDAEVFDQVIIMHINTALSTLTQLGIGPQEGFAIEDEDTEWTEFLGEDPQFNSAISYVYLKVRLLFDPPQTGYAIEAMERQIQEMEIRLNTHREETDWVAPV